MEPGYYWARFVEDDDIDEIVNVIDSDCVYRFGDMTRYSVSEFIFIRSIEFY